MGMAELTLGSQLLQQGVLWHASQRLQRLTGVLLSAKKAVKRSVVISSCSDMECSACSRSPARQYCTPLADVQAGTHVCSASRL